MPGIHEGRKERLAAILATLVSQYDAYRLLDPNEAMPYAHREESQRYVEAAILSGALSHWYQDPRVHRQTTMYMRRVYRRAFQTWRNCYAKCQPPTLDESTRLGLFTRELTEQVQVEELAFTTFFRLASYASGAGAAEAYPHMAAHALRAAILYASLYQDVGNGDPRRKEYTASSRSFTDNFLRASLGIPLHRFSHKPPALGLHHLDGNRRNNDLANLVAVPISAHA